MSRVLVIGGSRGIGNNVIKEQLANGDECVNISRNRALAIIYFKNLILMLQKMIYQMLII